ncbi:MAG: ParB/RepB/Spo0J family partition protein [Pirellulaceae bacterium]
MNENTAVQKTEPMLVDIAQLVAIQIRERLNSQVVDQYRELISDDGTSPLPPITVFRDPHDGTLRCPDGHHRIEAYLAAGYDTLPAIVREGDEQAAVLRAAGANATHGLPRSNEDKRRAVQTLLDRPQWQNKSSRWIAEQCHVSHVFVEVVRNGRGEEKPPIGTGNVTSSVRRGRDGKHRKPPQPVPPPTPKIQAPDAGRSESQQIQPLPALCDECGADNPQIDGRGKERRLCPQCFGRRDEETSVGSARSCGAPEQHHSPAMPLSLLVGTLVRAFVEYASEFGDDLHNLMARPDWDRKHDSDILEAICQIVAKLTAIRQCLVATASGPVAPSPAADAAGRFSVEQRPDGWHAKMCNGSTLGPYNARHSAFDAANKYCLQLPDDPVSRASSACDAKT